MASFNRVILAGNLTRDIELRETPGGASVADAGLAVNDRRKQGDEWVDETSFLSTTLDKGPSNERPIPPNHNNFYLFY